MHVCEQGLAIDVKGTASAAANAGFLSDIAWDVNCSLTASTTIQIGSNHSLNIAQADFQSSPKHPHSKWVPDDLPEPRTLSDVLFYGVDAFC